MGKRTMPTDKEIWGVPVAVSLAGRTNWPNKIKVIAVRKVLDEGERLADIGHEIGAHENLVRKWCNQERRARGESVGAQEPFASVTISSEPDATASELLSNLVFESFWSCGDLAFWGGFNSVFERDACDDFGEVVKAA